MTFLSPEIESAYYASPLPSEGCPGGIPRHKEARTRAMACYKSLEKMLAPQQLELVVEFGRALSEQCDIEGMFYFQCGWLAARKE